MSMSYSEYILNIVLSDSSLKPYDFFMRLWCLDVL